MSWPDGTGWIPATALVNGGDELTELLAAARRHWSAAPHVAAALTWKRYSYWLALPAVLGYATSGRVPLVRPEAVAVRRSAGPQFLTLGLAPAQLAVLPGDPAAAAGRSNGIVVVPDRAALLDALRTALIDDHLAPLMAQLRHRVNIGRHSLWGSLSAGIAEGLSRASEVIPGSTLEVADQVLTALGLRELVDLAPRQTPDGSCTGQLKVRRSTCCLAFTLPEPKICKNCVLRPA